MPQNVAGTGNTFNLPNYAGDLFTFLFRQLH